MEVNTSEHTLVCTCERIRSQHVGFFQKILLYMKMKTVRKGTCYVCGHTRSSTEGRYLHYHSIPSKNGLETITDQWLDFLHLPRLSFWREDTWKNITLCSLHFDDKLYHSRHQEQLRTHLPVGAVPTRKQPTGPGLLGERVSSTIPESSYSDSSAYCDEVGEQNRDDFEFPDSSSCCEEVLVQNRDGINNYVGIDHDYITSAAPRKFQVSETERFSKNKKEQLLIKQCSLENLRRDLCRLCGQAGSALIPIFEPASITSEDGSISSKIEMYLPIKVKLQDSLPLCICSDCLLVLNNWHQLYTICVAADKVLSKIFREESQEETAHSLCASQGRQNTETQTEKIHSYPLEDEMIRNGGICSLSGESNAGTLQTEDKSFKKEFDKFVCTYRRLSYKCRFCHELFKNSVERKSHIAMCHGLSTICELCGFKVPCRKDLMRHKFRKHKPKVPREYLCDKCHRFFQSVQGLQKHLNNFHGENSLKYCCELCGSVFRLEYSYRAHKRKHDEGKLKPVFQLKNFSSEMHSEDFENSVTYACPVCEEKFNDMLSLSVHVNEKKKLKCSLCQNVIANEKRLFLHVCGQWTCQYCLKSFGGRTKWVLHERLHTGEKPIKCRLCDRTYRTWTARRKHERKYHHL